VARFKDDGYSAFKEIRRDGFVNLIEAIERDEIDVVVIRDVDRLTRNLPDWSRFEKATIEHQVLLSGSRPWSRRLDLGHGQQHRRVLDGFQRAGRPAR
jgi:Resolvase, N terminal domain